MEYNMNPDQNDNGFQGKIKRFLDKQGFYLILAICLIILGATAFVTYRGLQKDKQEAQASANPTWMPSPSAEAIRQANVPMDESLKDAEISPSESPTESLSVSASPSPEATEKPKENKAQYEEKKEAKKTSEKESPSLYPMPVEGKVSQTYSGNALVYSKTLDQWTSHLGVDIEADEGASVKCIADGVVSKLTNDAMMGYSVSIKHSNEVESVYSNLKDMPNLSEGSSVKTGDIIGLVGRSAIAEHADNPHLHFELFIDGKSVDPSSKLSGMSK